MEEVLILLLQILGEVLFQVFGSGFLDLLTWSWETDQRPQSRGTVIVILLGLGAGGILGWLSLLVVPHSMLPFAWMRFANLFIGPAISAWVSWRIATWRASRGAETDPGTHAMIAGLACAGMVVIRFVGGVR